MHLFYRILCLTQFAQMRAARPWNYGLDKEIVLLTGILPWKGDGQRRIVPTHSFSYSCHQAFSEHLFQPSRRARCWDREAAAQPGGGGRHPNRWLQHPGRFNNTHGRRGVWGKARRRGRFPLQAEAQAEREKGKCLPSTPHSVQKGASTQPCCISDFG